MLSELITESVNPGSMDIDRKSIPEILALMNQNDRQVPLAVEKVMPEIARAVEIIVATLQNGGRLFYIGAGTSGRLVIADAAECPPTFGVSPDLVQALIAGGRSAVFRAREGCEDKERMGVVDLKRRGFTGKDVLVGVSASGRTPYVVGALRLARELKAPTISVISNRRGKMVEFSDVLICPIVGPEVIMGSTRLKAGSAAKLILNMISTTVMIKLGRVSGNMMSNMQVTCGKLRERAINMVMISGKIDRTKAETLLEETGFNVETALKKLKKTP